MHYLELADRELMSDCVVGIESLRRVKLSTFIKVIVLYDAKEEGGGRSSCHNDLNFFTYSLDVPPKTQNVSWC